MVQPHECVLVVIDIQQRLFPVMQDSKTLVRNVSILTQGAQLLGVPVIYTEQAPAKVGTTIEALQTVLQGRAIEKDDFSCWGAPDFRRALVDSKRSTVIVAGIEAHVCVYQTVVDLLTADYEVEVVSDGVSSRKGSNKMIALSRMNTMKAGITTTEMIIMEWVRTTTHPRFKEILTLIK